ASLEKCLVEVVHCVEIFYVAQIYGREHHVGEVHIGLLQSIQQVPHGLPELQIEILSHNSLPGNKSIFCGKVQCVSVKNSWACRCARRHIARANRFALRKISASNASEDDVASIGQGNHLNCSPPRCVAELEICLINVPHSIVLPAHAHVWVHPKN